MSYKLYQVTFDAEGNVTAVFQLPDEVARPRTVFVREETPIKARKVAEDLYSLAK